jgi:hypothetical protein
LLCQLCHAADARGWPAHFRTVIRSRTSPAAICVSGARLQRWALMMDTGAVSNGHTSTHFPRSLAALSRHSGTHQTCLTRYNG